MDNIKNGLAENETDRGYEAGGRIDVNVFFRGGGDADGKIELIALLM